MSRELARVFAGCRKAVVAVGLILTMNFAAHAQIVTGSDGSDGAFVFVQDTGPSAQANTMTIDLALAASGLDGQGQPITWQTPSPVAGRGVYDPFVWAVVFKYSAIAVPAGKTVRFANHPSRAPVVWLVAGSVVVEAGGQVVLDGEGSFSGDAHTEPGPGGFRSGQPILGVGTDGFGPGGGVAGIASYGNHASAQVPTPTYGSSLAFPLIGGSGAISDGGTSRPGGGALLVAADTSIELQHGTALRAIGASWAAGGTIRLVSDRITRSGLAILNAGSDGTGGVGRVRLEANTFAGPLTGTPAPTFGAPGRLLQDASTPIVRVVSIVSIGQIVAVPADPRASTSITSADVVLNGAGKTTIWLETRNVAPGGTCTVRVLDVQGRATSYTSTPLTGSPALSTASASVLLQSGIYAVQARVVL